YCLRRSFSLSITLTLHKVITFFLYLFIYFFRFVMFLILRARVNGVLDRGKNSSGVHRFFFCHLSSLSCGAFRVWDYFFFFSFFIFYDKFGAYFLYFFGVCRLPPYTPEWISNQSPCCLLYSQHVTRILVFFFF